MYNNENIFVADTENTVPKSLIYQNEDVLKSKREENLYIYYDSAKSVESLKQLANKQAKGFRTETWAFAITNISKNPKRDDVTTWNSLDLAMQNLISGKQYRNSLIYFHNLSYDGKQIIDWLIKNGYTYQPFDDATEYTEVQKGAGVEVKTKYRKGVEEKTFSASISGQGQWYEILIATDAYDFTYEKEEIIDGDLTLRLARSMKTISIRDSLKILPFSVDKISKDLDTKFGKLTGTIDYTIPRYAGWNITPTEQKYIDNDVLVMAEAMFKIRSMGVKEMTIGSHAFKQFKKMRYSGTNKKQKSTKFIEQRYRNEFPELEPELDSFLRKAYYGAVTFNKFDDNLVNLTDPNFKPNKGTRPLTQSEQVLLNNGQMFMYKYDVNSMYPTVMYYNEDRAKDPLFDFKYPYGDAYKINSEDEFYQVKADDDKCYIVKIKATFKVKDGHMNWLQSKETTLENERKEFIKEVKIPTEFTMTSVDLEQLNKHYDINYFEFVDGYWFKSVKGLFNQYIDYWYNKKNEAKATGNNVMYLLSKLMLNNLYGKFAQKVVRESSIPVLNGDHIAFELEEYELNTGYVPLGAYITAYARRYLVESIQPNWDRFYYCDTDSMVILGEATGITLGDELGDWDLEGVSQIARFVRQKTYVTYGHPVHNQIIDTSKLKLDIKACGCPESTKTRMKYKVTFENGPDDFIFLPLEKDQNGNIISEERTPLEVIERFTYGIVEAGKLSKKTVDGGAILFETTFAIL